MLTASANATHPTSRRFTVRLPRPLWIGLVTLLLIVMSVGLRLGLPIYRQHAAVRAIQRLGRDVTLRTRCPQWLRDRVGEERANLFDEVVEVDLGETAADDSMLVHVGQLRGLQTLFLNHTKVTDTGLAHLTSLTGLQSLYLGDTAVTDRGIAHLEGLAGLQELSLTRTHVTDSGIVHLKAMTNLKFIGLAGTKVTDAGLAHLKGFTELEYVELYNTKVTRAGKRELKRALPGAEISL
jgi:hypothetical protein